MAPAVGPLPGETALDRPAPAEPWLSVVRPLLSSAAGVLLGAAFVGGAVLRLGAEAPVAPAEAPAAVVTGIVPSTTATESPAPAPTPAPVEVTAAPVVPPPPEITATAYRSGGRLHAAISAKTGATLGAPLAGRVEVRLYQLINGEVRVGSSVAGLAYYPYVVIRSGDRVLTLRPGALGVDSELLVKDGVAVAVGTPLVRLIGDGPSSWKAFYDRALEAQVVASLTNSAGVDLDAVALFARH